MTCSFVNSIGNRIFFKCIVIMTFTSDRNLVYTNCSLVFGPGRFTLPIANIYFLSKACNFYYNLKVANINTNVL